MNRIATQTKTNPLRDKLEVSAPMDSITYLNLLIYGEPGAGKTYLAGTAQDDEDTSPILFLDVEGGTVTLRKRKDIDVKQVRSIEEVIEVHRMLALENEGYYKTVVVDSLSELQKLDMREVMKAAVRDRPQQDEDVPSQREWGKSGERIRRIVRGYRDLQMNTIFTCLAGSERDNNNRTILYPSLPGKLRAEIPGFIDVCGYLYSKIEEDEYVRRIQFAKTETVVAKDRTSALGDVVENPSIPLLWNMIRNS